LRFVAITASNADDFFMVRVGGLKMLQQEGREKPDPAGLTPSATQSVPPPPPVTSAPTSSGQSSTSPSSPSTPKPEPTESPRPVVRSVSTAAGQVWAYCVGDTAYRRSVVATDGWSFEFSREDNGRFEVKFQLAGAEEEEVEVKVRCEAGLPVFTTD